MHGAAGMANWPLPWARLLLAARMTRGGAADARSWRGRLGASGRKEGRGLCPHGGGDCGDH
eukprot:13753280-Alexandrium_andersonii.AAC.1